MACAENLVHMVDKLLSDKRVNVNKGNIDRVSPFLVACDSGNMEVVKRMMQDERVDINSADVCGDTPLFVACSKGNIELCRMLLSAKGIKRDIRNKGHATPFFIACKSGKKEVVDLLMEDKEVGINSPNREGYTPLHVADSDEIAIKIMNDPRSSLEMLTRNGNSVLHCFCRTRMVSAVKHLLSLPAAPSVLNQKNDFGITPLWLACSLKYDYGIEIVELLLEHPLIRTEFQDINGIDAFGIACKKGNIKVVESFIKHDKICEVNISKYNPTPLWLACKYNPNTQLVKALLGINEVDVNQASRENPGDEMIAPYELVLGYPDIMDCLLESGRHLEIRPIFARYRGSKRLEDYFLSKVSSKKRTREEED